MSNSLTINTPNIVQQNTPLRNVPSGSTAEPDYSVKFVPQDLTEAQQAQARQNIGAISESEIPAQVQADWNQSDDTAVDYIKNKPNIGEPVYNEYEDMARAITVYTDTLRNGNWSSAILEAVIQNGVYTKFSELSVGDITPVKSVSIVAQSQRNNIGSLSFSDYYQPSIASELWMYTGYAKDSGVKIISPVGANWVKDANLVVRGHCGSSNEYRRMNVCPGLSATGKDGLQKTRSFTVWNTSNTRWADFWTGTGATNNLGNVVLFDVPTTMGHANFPSFFDQNGPSALINFTLYLPKSRYYEFVSLMTTAWGSSVVENYILPKVETYNYIAQDGYRFKMVKSDEWPSDERIICEYNVTTAGDTQIAGSITNFSSMEVDGVEMSPSTTYSFSTTGMHTVKWTLINKSSIPAECFRLCGTLSSIVMPNTITEMGNVIFDWCEAMTEFKFTSTFPPILGGDGVFNNTGSAPIYVPAASIPAYKTANYWGAVASRITALP